MPKPNTHSCNPAVVLLSGGLDSTTTLAIAKSQGYKPYALSFRYGQRHSVELVAAKGIARKMGVCAHVIADIDLRCFGGSALTDDIAVPKGRDEEEMGNSIPITYVPGAEYNFLVVFTCLGGDIGCPRHLHRCKCPGLQRVSRLPSRVHCRL